MDAAEIDLLAGNPWVTRRKITVADYHEMGKAGILTPDDRVELIEGELVAMAPIGTELNGAVGWLTRALVRAIGDRAIVLVQGSIRLDVKRPLYARAGIPEFWIVNLAGGEVEVCRQPANTGYADVKPAGRGETLEPTPLAGVAISVSELLG